MQTPRLRHFVADFDEWTLPTSGARLVKYSGPARADHCAHGYEARCHRLLRCEETGSIAWPRDEARAVRPDRRRARRTALGAIRLSLSTQHAHSLGGTDSSLVRHGPSSRRIGIRYGLSNTRTLGTNAMTDLHDNRAESAPAVRLNLKLRAALDYLGDRLSTHPTSRFQPPSRPLLDQWLATRRPRPKGSVRLAVGSYRSWVSSSEWT